jgi:CheY-like chemotaxis protein
MRDPIAHDQSSRQVLVVDDDESIRNFVELALDTEGYYVSSAQNGAVALDVAGQQPPDLILLDMRMPVMDGWAFAQAYRSQPGPHAPIIVITAAPDAGQRAAEINADGYLGKPFDLDELLGLVDHYLRQR